MVPFTRAGSWLTSNPAALARQLQQQEQTIAALVDAEVRRASESRRVARIRYGWSTNVGTTCVVPTSYYDMNEGTLITEDDQRITRVAANRLRYDGAEPAVLAWHARLLTSSAGSGTTRYRLVVDGVTPPLNQQQSTGATAVWWTCGGIIVVRPGDILISQVAFSTPGTVVTSQLDMTLAAVGAP